MLTAAGASQPPNEYAAASMLEVSLPQRLHLAKKDHWGEEEGLWSLTCTLTGGHIVGVRDIQYEWSAYVENGKKSSKFEASQLVASFALSGDRLDHLRRLFTIQRSTQREKATALRIGCDLDVSDIDEKQHRYIHLDQGQILLESRRFSEDSKTTVKEMWTVSPPQVRLGQAEKVVSLAFKVSGGRIVCLKGIPRFWAFGVANDDPLTGELSGFILAPTAALTKERLSDLKRFVTVQRLHTDAEPRYDMPFRISLVLKIQTAPERYRYLKLGSNEVTLEAVR